MPVDFQEGSYGVVRIIVTILDADDAVVDLSSTLTRQLIFEQPNGDNLTVTASFYTDGTDGKLYYDFVLGNLVHGKWRVQAFYTKVGGQVYTSVEVFRVGKNLG